MATPLKTREDILKECLSQLRRLMMSQVHTIEWLEKESLNESEYPIKQLAYQLEYPSTLEFIRAEFMGYLKFKGNQIKAGPKLYDSDVLQDIVSMNARTVPKVRNGYNNYQRGGYGSAGNNRPSTSYAPVQRRRTPSPKSFPQARRPLSNQTLNNVQSSSIPTKSSSSSRLIAGPPPGFSLNVESENSAPGFACNAENENAAPSMIVKDEAGSTAPPPPDPKHQRSNSNASSNSDEEYFDALEDFEDIQIAPKIKLPPCLTFGEPPNNPNVEPINAEMIRLNQELFDVPSTFDSEEFLDYFVGVLTELHLSILNKPAVEFYDAIKNLPTQVRLDPGYDVLSIYSIIKALGSSFFAFIEDKKIHEVSTIFIKTAYSSSAEKQEYEIDLRRSLEYLMPILSLPDLPTCKSLRKATIYEAKKGKYPYFIKLSSNAGQETRLGDVLKSVKTHPMTNPYPRAICLYFHNDKPYRAQILAEHTQLLISIELVDIGEFLTVARTRLKSVEGGALASFPRFAIPCRLEGEAMPNLEKAQDRFGRRSTNKSVPMYISPVMKKKYVSIKLF